MNFAANCSHSFGKLCTARLRAQGHDDRVGFDGLDLGIRRAVRYAIAFDFDDFGILNQAHTKLAKRIHDPPAAYDHEYLAEGRRRFDHGDPAMSLGQKLRNLDTYESAAVDIDMIAHHQKPFAYSVDEVLVCHLL